jgi:hypothetical protein
MNLTQLRASLALWRSRLLYRSARWKFWQAAHNKAGVAKWEKLRLEAIDRINLRKKQIEELLQPKTLTMYDSVDVSTVPANPQAVAGYVDGKYQTFNGLVKAFPHAHHLSIAVFASGDGDCLDVETGDASPSEAPAWVRRQKARGVKRPCLYANLSTMPAVKEALLNGRIGRHEVRLWVAHWTKQPHIPPGFDACQYDDAALGRNLDASLCVGSFFR